MKYITKQDRIVGLNPFIVNHPIEAVALPKKVAIKESDDLSSPIDKLLDTHYLYDSQNKVSLYRFSKSAIYNTLFGMLTSRARDLFMYIMYAINKDEDYILLSASRVKEDIGISNRTLIEAIKELRACNIITNKSRSVYWVNPHYIFNGNRLEYYRNLDKDNIVVKSILRK